MSHEWFGDEDGDVLDQFAVVPLAYSHPAKRYLGFGQNDADVLGITVGRDSLEVRFSHYDIGRLACELVDDPPRAWPVMKGAFPVTFRFDCVTDFVILRTVEQGVYQKIRTTQSSIGEAVLDVVQMECVHDAPGRQRYVLRINGGGGRFKRRQTGVGNFAYNDEYALCIEASALTVKEGYREGWLRMFNGQHLDVLDEFENVWPVPMWGMVDFEHWLKALHRRD